MNAFLIMGSFVFGVIVGSFLNVVVLRYNTGKTIKGRSVCLSCGRVLSWRELVPVVSFFVQWGRCRSCRSALSFQYPLVELSTGLLFVGAFLKFLPNGYVAPASEILSLTVVLFALSLLVVITVYDLRHKIIPDSFVYTFLLSGLVLLLLTDAPYFDFLAGPIYFTPFALLWFISKGTWMGFGDAKLAWGMGWFLGLLNGIAALLLAFWVGAIYSIVLLLMKHGLLGTRLSKKLSLFTMKSEIPFAPFLILGTLISFFFDMSAYIKLFY